MIFFRKYYHVAILVLVWLASVLFTWRVVENPYWDFADMLYCAERIGSGQVIYQDFQHPYPPLIFWLYGGVMKIFPHSYAAVSLLSTLSALLFLISNYKISTLLHPGSDSLKIAVGIYLGFFAVSSAVGENFITFGFVFIGITIFNWFIWLAAKLLRQKLPNIWTCLGAGFLAGLCLLSKHERMAGVVGVFAFLALVFLFWKRNRIYFLRLLVLLFCALVVGAGGYGLAIIQAGWFNVFSSLTQYGVITNSAAHNTPALVDVGSQIFLAALHFGFVMLVLAWALWRGKDNAGRKIVPLALKYVFGAVAICLLLSALESFRVIAVARQIDFSTAKYISRTMLAIAFYSPQGVQLVQSLVNYFGSLVFGNLLPVISVILALLAGLVVARLCRRGPVLPQPSRKWLFSMLLLCAAFCLQARFLARRSEIGALACVLPVFFVYAERIPFMILRLKPKLSLWRVFKRCYLTAFVIAVFLAAFVLYAFEFRDVSLHPVLVRSDKGTIRLPDLPINRAFVQMVAFVRNNDLTRFKVVVVPTSGIQYWIGGQFSPFAWASIIQPEQYRSPWSDNLKAGLEKNGCIFIELCRQEVNVQSIVSSAEWSWIDGPAYRVERWKELFPLIWNHIQTNAVPVAEFGPTNAPYFRVYIDRKLKSADNLPKTE